MKGHIRERSRGHWAIILDIPDPQTGKRRRQWHSFKGTKREAQIESARLISAVQTGTYLEPSKTTFSLSQELEHRLRGSFIEEDKNVDFYGSQSNAVIPR
jgi:hypothetical protein